ncbi:hypothetical protein OAF27_00135 [Verrucomicrobiales bacterium]|nr:hypothetical protein [Verrucomicrobiales bacterium]
MSGLILCILGVCFLTQCDSKNGSDEAEVLDAADPRINSAFTTTTDEGELRIVTSEEPLILACGERLGKLLEELETPEAIALLLGQGTPLNDDGTEFHYTVIPPSFYGAFDELLHPFTDEIIVRYGPDGNFVSFQAIDSNNVPEIGAKQLRFWRPLLGGS